MTDDYRNVLLQLIGSLSLAEHMGEVKEDMDVALRQIGIEVEWEDGNELANHLHKLGVTTLYGTSLGDDD